MDIKYSVLYLTYFKFLDTKRGGDAMSYIVARMQKMKSQNLGGIQKHNQREFERNSNQDIDEERSHMNVDLVNPSNIDYRDRIMNTINEQKEGTRAIRKDAVLVNEWIITSDQKFFKGMDLEQTENFFTAATAFFEERYGKQNLAYGQVHLDETTPHMHLGVVPMKDGKLQAKNVFNRKELLTIQAELPLFLEKKGFKVERGEPNGERKHLTVSEFKGMQSRIAEMAQIEEEKERRIKTLEEENRLLEVQIERSKEDLEIEHPKPMVYNKRQESIKGKPETVYTVSHTELSRLNGIRRASNTVLAENQKLEKENKLLNARISVLEKTQEQISNIFKTAQKHASRIAEGVFERAVTYAKHFFENNDPVVEEEKNKMLKSFQDSPSGVEDYQNYLDEKRRYEKQKSLER